MFPKVVDVMREKKFTQKSLLEAMKKRGFIMSKGSLSMKLSGNRPLLISEMEIIAEILDECPCRLFFDNKYTKCGL